MRNDDESEGIWFGGKSQNEKGNDGVIGKRAKAGSCLDVGRYSFKRSGERGENFGNASTTRPPAR